MDLLSNDLASALDTFSEFLIEDDVARSVAIDNSDHERLSALAAAVDPLFEEINAVLDRLVAKDHPLPEHEEQLEYDLNSLAQAGMEARTHLEERGEG